MRANSIATAQALSNAGVRAFTANNILPAKGRTDGNSLWRHARKDPWETRERPAIVPASFAAPAATGEKKALCGS